MFKQKLYIMLSVIIIVLVPFTALASDIDSEYMSPNADIWQFQDIISATDKSDFVCKSKMINMSDSSTIYILLDIIDYSVTTDDEIDNITVTVNYTANDKTHTIELNRKSSMNKKYASFIAATNFDDITIGNNQKASFARGAIVVAIKVTDSDIKKAKGNVTCLYYSANTVHKIFENKVADFSVTTTAKNKSTSTKSSVTSKSAQTTSTTLGDEPWTNDDNEYIEEEYTKKSKNKSKNKNKKTSTTKYKAKSTKVTKYSTTGIASESTTSSDVQSAINSSKQNLKFSTLSKIGIIASIITAAVALYLIIKGTKAIKAANNDTIKKETVFDKESDSTAENQQNNTTDKHNKD